MSTDVSRPHKLQGAYYTREHSVFLQQVFIMSTNTPQDLKLETKILDNTALHSLLFSLHISSLVNNAVIEMNHLSTLSQRKCKWVLLHPAGI